MNIQEFNRRILQKQKQLSDLMRRKMPVIAGNIAKRHIEEDFRKGDSPTTASTNGRKPSDRKAEEREPVPATARCFPVGAIWQGASNIHREIDKLPFSPVCHTPAFITGEERCILLSLLRCDASPGRSTTGKQAKTRRKTPSGSALP